MDETQNSNGKSLKIDDTDSDDVSHPPFKPHQCISYANYACWVQCMTFARCGSVCDRVK